MLTGADVRAAGRWTLDRDPYLLETSVPGIFACGDVRFAPVKRVAAAVGEGSMAIAFVHQYLKDADAAALSRGRSIARSYRPLTAVRIPRMGDASAPASRDDDQGILGERVASRHGGGAGERLWRPRAARAS